MLGGDPPWWLGWLAIAIIPLTLLATLLYSRWAYKFGRRMGGPGSQAPYRWFSIRVGSWTSILLGLFGFFLVATDLAILILPLPVAYFVTSYHLPTLCYKQGVRRGVS